MLRRLISQKFDGLEVVLIAGLVATVVWVVGRPRSQPIPPEGVALQAKYGPHRNSENAEEWIVRDFFQDKHSGVFVDVGANDYKKFNNTYYLETALGWHGVAIEPLRQFEADYLKYRPATKFRAFFISDISNKQAKVFVGSDPLVTSGSKRFTSRFGSIAQETTAPTITLNDLLTHEEITRIDYLSMDIEGWEPKALAGFDIDRFRPTLVCIEAHPEVRQQILDYFSGHRYILVGKYLRADPWNLYFTPQVAK